jgi:hypothetical protein
MKKKISQTLYLSLRKYLSQTQLLITFKYEF